MDGDTLGCDAAIDVSTDRPMRQTEHNTSVETGNPKTQGDDPDVAVDPNDSGPRLSVTLKESSPLEMYVLPAAKAEQITGRYPFHYGSIKSAPIAF
jgi:hypothetical protein